MTVPDVPDTDPVELITHAGFPNPHRRRDVQPTPAGPPVALGPAVGQDQCEHERRRDPDVQRRGRPKAGAAPEGVLRPAPQETPLSQEATSRGASAATAEAAPGASLLSEQVLQQKAKIRQLEAEAAAKAAAKAAQGRQSDAEEGEEDEEDEDDESEGPNPRAALESLLAQVAPCAPAYPVALVQSAERQRIETGGEKWTYIKGLRLAVRPAKADDCVLLVANCMLTTEADRQDTHWAIHRGGHKVSPKFATHSRQKEWGHAICMPYLDQPGKLADTEYQVAANTGADVRNRFEVSPNKQKKHFAAVTIPAAQAVWVEDDERQSIGPGPWVDIEGMYEVITTLPGERVLAICTLRYAASWASELNRGRFTLVRDDFGLDGLADRGLQSVRALGPNLHRTLLMVTVDEPPPGPHLYRARAALTVGTETGVTTTLQGDRQLALIRLPGSIVSGPNYVERPVTIDEARWTEIPGLSASITLRKPRDRVLVVFHVDCNPQQYHYEAHFTIFRRSENGPAVNLGYTEEFGVDMVFSDYAAASEYPAGIFCDAPGSLGTWTYHLAARVANMGTSSENPPVMVGYSGSFSTILLSTR